MREFMRTAPGGGAWVDDVCNKLMLELTATHLEDLTLQFGAKSANVVITRDNKVQLNVAWKDTTSWACFTADTFTAAINQMWQQVNLIASLQQERKHDI